MIRKIKNADRLQKMFLIIMCVMIAVFAVLYIIANSREGVKYNGAYLAKRSEGENTVYAGKLKGRDLKLTLSPEGSIVYGIGDRTYGPYKVEQFDYDGIAISRENETLFRGRINGDQLFNEDGTVFMERPLISYNGNGSMISYTVNGEPASYTPISDPDEPMLHSIAAIARGLETTHRGQWIAYFFGVFICLLNAIYIIYADELFRFALSFSIRNAHSAEPSELELIRRELGWTVLCIAALIVFIIGLIAYI